MMTINRGGEGVPPYLKMFPAREEPADLASPPTADGKSALGTTFSTHDGKSVLGTTFSTQASQPLQSHSSTITLGSTCSSPSSSRCCSSVVDDGFHDDDHRINDAADGDARDHASLSLQHQAEIFVSPPSFQSHFLHAGLRELQVGHLHSTTTSLGEWFQTLRLLSDSGCRRVDIERFTIPDGCGKELRGSLQLGGSGGAAQLQLEHLPASPLLIADARCGRFAGLTSLVAAAATATPQLLRALSAIRSLQRLELLDVCYADAGPAGGGGGGGGHSSQPLPVLPLSGSGQALLVWRADPLACLAALTDLRRLRICVSPASPPGLALTDATLDAWKGGLLELQQLAYQGPTCDGCRHSLNFKGLQELRSIKVLGHLQQQQAGGEEAGSDQQAQQQQAAIPVDFLSLPAPLRSLTLGSVRVGPMELQLLAANATRLQQLTLVGVERLARLLPAIAAQLTQLSHLALVDGDVLQQPAQQPAQQPLAGVLQPLLQMPRLASLTFASRSVAFTAADMSAARHEQRLPRAAGAGAGPQLQVLVLLVPRPGGWELLSGRCLGDVRGGSPRLEQARVAGMVQQLLAYQPEC